MNSMNRERIVGAFSHQFLLRRYDTWFDSPKFTIEGIDDCNFHLQVRLNHKPVSLQILLKKSSKNRNAAKITVCFHQKEITRIVDDWIDTCSLTNEILELVMVDIEINCEIIWYNTRKGSSPIQAPTNLFSDFKNFYLNSSLSDFKISISGEELSVHKFILAAHSPVFLSMFETDMKEKKDNRIVIEGIELDVMKIVLSILYTGCDKDLDEVGMALKVLIVAERYDMKTLKTSCEWKLCQKLEVSNVLGILEEADTCNAEILCAACMDFILENKKQMVGAEYLKTICHRKPGVVCELLNKFMSTP